MLCSWYGFILFIAGMFAVTLGDTFIECEGKDQMYVELQEDCSFYIFCHGEESFSDSCPDESPYFSFEEQTCDTDKSICKDRPIPNEITNAPIAEIATSTEYVPTNFSSDINTPIPVVSSTDSSANITSTDASVQAGTTSPATPSIQTIIPTPVVPFTCPPIDNPNKAIFLPHTKSCSEYFLCYRGQRLPMHCSNLLHFDLRQQKCDYPQNVKCHMMDVASPREQCLPHTFDFYPHPRNCNYYYQCTLGYLKVMQCPLNMGWHYERRACVMRSQAKCYRTFARKF